jgi:hypothetical protein
MDSASQMLTVIVSSLGWTITSRPWNAVSVALPLWLPEWPGEHSQVCVPSRADVTYLLLFLGCSCRIVHVAQPLFAGGVGRILFRSANGGSFKTRSSIQRT